MANADIQLYNFYRRYRWRAEDFTGWQTGMVDHSRGMFEGLFGGGILEGFEVAPQGGNLILDVSAGISSGPTGFLNVVNTVTELEFDAPTGSNPVRNLIVVRPSLIDNTYITKPTSPYETVPLRTTQASELIIIEGTPSSSPVYPSTQANDVVIAGVRLQPGQTVLARTDLDFEVRDLLGKNSVFQQQQAKYDDRARPYRSTNTTLGIKPSQTRIGDRAKAFLYINKSVPSKFPMDISSNFNLADTFINFDTGAVTGGDEQTLNFTPVIPTAGNWIVATVSIKPDNTLSIVFGTEGTRAECFNAIENQETSGPGSINSPSQVMRVAFVVLGSNDGASITELDFADARSTFYFGGPDTIKVYPNVFLSSQGSGDYTDLGDALAAMPVNGGVLLVMDNVDVLAPVTVLSNIKIIGRGKGAGLNFAGASGMIVTGDNVIIQDLVLSATGNIPILSIQGDYGVVEKCNFDAPSGGTAICIRVAADGAHIGECVFTGVLSPSTSTGIQYEAGGSENSDEFNVFTT